MDVCCSAGVADATRVVTVPRYTPGPRPVGLMAAIRLPGAFPDAGATLSHPPPETLAVKGGAPELGMTEMILVSVWVVPSATRTSSEVGSARNERLVPAWVIVKGVPETESVPVLELVLVLAEMANSTVPDPVPELPLVTEIHGGTELTAHAHPGGDKMPILPLPPDAGNVALAGERLYVQGAFPLIVIATGTSRTVVPPVNVITPVYVPDG